MASQNTNNAITASNTPSNNSLPNYQGQLVNGFAPIAGYSNSNPILTAGNKLDGNAPGGQSPINPTQTTYTQGQSPANPSSVDAFFNSLTPDQQNSINAVSNQFGGDKLAAAKFYGYENLSNPGANGTTVNAGENPLFTAAINANKSTGTGSASAQTGSTTPLPSSNSPLNTIATPTGTPAASTTPGTSPSTGMANSGTAAAIANNSPVSSDGSSALSTKYGATLSNLQESGTAAPSTSGAGSAAVAGASPAQTNPATQPDTTQAQTVLDNNNAYQQYIKDYTASQTAQSQQESLTQEYTQLQNQLGIPGLQTELMNMQNIIQGTDSDIRTEISKAGGFATDSQVAAMAVSRNKILTQNYNQLLQTYTNATNNVNTMIGLDEKDQAIAQQKISSQLDFDKNMIDYTQKAQTNAVSSLNDMQKTEGWDGILKAAQASGDPQAIAKINSTMGNGFNLSIMASQDAVARTNAQNKDDEELKVQKSTIDVGKSTAAKNYSDISKNNADIRKLNDDAGVPDPAKANAPGFNAQGVKYTISSATNELQNEIKSQGMMGSRKLLSPENYNQMKAWWVSNNLSDKDFDSEFGGYKDQSKKIKPLYN